MTQGEHLKALIKRKKTNITQLAAKSSVPRETISKIANDKQGLGPDVAPKLARALRVSLNELVLPKAAEAESRAGLENRLRAVEAEARWLRTQLARAFLALGIPLELPEEEPPAQSGGVRP